MNQEQGLDRETQLATHQRPRGVDGATVSSVGKLSEALEKVEEARGQLYAFHRLCGSADLSLGEAVDELREAGHVEAADLGPASIQVSTNHRDWAATD